jgi:hypothetical protein
MTDKQDIVEWARAAASTYPYNDVTADELVEVYIPALLAEVERLRHAEMVSERQWEGAAMAAKGTSMVIDGLTGNIADLRAQNTELRDSRLRQQRS